MKYYSTNNKSHRVSLREAVLNGLAPDGGLYMSELIPELEPTFFKHLSSMTLPEIGYEVIKPFVDGEIDDKRLRTIINETLNFEIPLVSVGNQHVLELFHGPTLAFKDVGARFMARLMGAFLEGDERPLTILVATSGDTGSAVAHGFYRIPGIQVVILFPKGKVSPLQERQMTTLGENITALAVEGTFDDCQRLVKEAFLDKDLRSQLRLSSANSINIARLLPQMIYYFWGLSKFPPFKGGIKGGLQSTVFSVPSGNFGNLTAGLMAKRMGLPIEQFIAATNANDVVLEYLETALFRPRPSIATISNAMDVGSPSNFARMLEFYPTVDALRNDVVGVKVSDEETSKTIKQIHDSTGYTLDPHGAVGYTAMQKLGRTGIVFETAHPAKFREVVESCLDKQIELPERLSSLAHLPTHTTTISNDLISLRRLLTKPPF